MQVEPIHSRHLEAGNGPAGPWVAVAERPSFFAELKRRNVLRAAVLYIGAVWALSQGISQLSGPLGLANWVTVWFLIACAIAFPLWLAFAWFYEWTPQGLKRESQIAGDASITRSTGRRVDRAIIAVMAVAIALLASGYFVRRHAPVARAAVPTAIPARSIAVLPFENLSADEANEYFVAGMQDLILTKLADIGSLKVIARTSTKSYDSHPESLTLVGQQLGVATILEGSVQKAGNQVLINVQLIDAKTDSHIWAESYTRTLDNIFGVEGEVAEQVATSLKAKLSPGEIASLSTGMSSSSAANDLFLRAEYLANLGGVNYDTATMKQSIPLYRHATEQDPDFASAWARMSSVESQLAWFGGGGLDLEGLAKQARADAEYALKLAPNASASQIALGYSDYYGRLDYAAALKDFAAALTVSPNDVAALAATGYVLRRQNRFEAAIASLKQALVLDPRNSSLTFELGATNMMVSRYPAAEQLFQRALAIDPDNFNAKVGGSYAIVFSGGDIFRALAVAHGNAPQLQLQRVTLLTWQRQYTEALALLASIPDTYANFQPGRGVSKPLLQANLYRLMGDDIHARPLFAQALIAARAQLETQQRITLAQVWQKIAAAQMGMGQTVPALDAVAKAQAIITTLSDKGFTPWHMEVSAALYAEAERPDLAVPLLAKALASPGIGINYAPVLLWLDPSWDPIRRSPQFQALLKKYAEDKPAVIPTTASTAAASTD